MELQFKHISEGGRGEEGGGGDGGGRGGLGWRCSKFRRFIQRAEEETEHDKELSTRGGAASASKKLCPTLEQLPSDV